MGVRRGSSGRQADEELVELVRRQLETLPLTVRGMFGGRGLYLGGKYFGVIFDGRLYFRTDVESWDDYLSRDMPALQPTFRPRGPKTVDRNFEVPLDVLTDAALLKESALRGPLTAVPRPRSLQYLCHDHRCPGAGGREAAGRAKRRRPR